jgi:uncharacterized membrane protein
VIAIIVSVCVVVVLGAAGGVLLWLYRSMRTNCSCSLSLSLYCERKHFTAADNSFQRSVAKGFERDVEHRHDYNSNGMFHFLARLVEFFMSFSYLMVCASVYIISCRLASWEVPSSVKFQMRTIKTKLMIA